MKQLLRFLLCALLSTTFFSVKTHAQGTTCAPLDGLLCQFPFNEMQGTVAQDATGQVGNGTLYDQCTWQPSGGFDGNGALALTGDGRVDIPLNWTQPSRFTVTFWLKPTGRYDYTQGIGENRGWGWFLFHSGNGGYLCVGTDINSRICVGGEPMKLNQWQQFTFTFDNGQGVIYRNGLELGRASGMAIPSDWQTLRIGGRAETLIDELRLYNRALTAQEVQQTYSCPTSTTYLPPSRPAANNDRNWTLERNYDGNGNVIAESKQFTDALGRPTQAQARDAATKQVFAAQTVYNSGGEGVLQTLAAPTNNQAFSYKEGFITAGGSDYGPANFEQAKTNAPDAVDATTPGTLGYYFSKQNTQEPLTPVTGYPYSLSELYEGPSGGVKRVAGVGDEVRMGRGHETKSRTFPVRKEFDDYLRLRPHFVPGSPQVTMEYQGLKTVSVDANGQESLTVTNKEGQEIISCLSGPQYGTVPVFGFISSEENGGRAGAGTPAYFDVHIPAAGTQDVKFTMFSSALAGGKIRIVNLLTATSTDYVLAPKTDGSEPELHVNLDPGFYRFVSLIGTQWSYYEAHYGHFSYTYYDDAGRAIATVAPNGLTGNTNYVRDPGFEQDGTSTPSNWLTCTAPGNGAPTTSAYSEPGTSTLPHGGGYYGVQWGANGHSAYTYQLIKGLPTGLYTARAWVKNTGNNSTAVLVAENYGGSQRRADVPITYSWGAWKQIQITNISVVNGQCQLGFYSVSPVDAWIIFDDVELVRQSDGSQPTFTTRNTFDSSNRLLATESNDEGRSDYVYARDGRIRFSQTALQRSAGRFSYSNYDEIGRVVESGEYTPGAAGTSDVEFESHALNDDKLVAGTLIEAENSQYYNDGHGPNGVATASGGADIGWLVNNGNYVQFALPGLQPGTAEYEVQLRYSTGGSDVRTLNLLVNGTTQQVQFPGTGDWGRFAMLHLRLQLPVGTPALRFEVGGNNAGYVDLDYLRIVQPATSYSAQEAENATFVNSNNNQPGLGITNASGGSNVNWLTNPGNYVRFSAVAPRAGAYTLVLRYSSGGSDTRSMSLLVNEAPATQLAFPGTGGWNNFSTINSTVNLRAGVNSIQVLFQDGDLGWIDLDLMSLTSGNQLSALTRSQSVHDIVEDRTRTGGLNTARCTQRNQVWYDLPQPLPSDARLTNWKQDFLTGAVAKTQNDNVATWYSYDEMGRVSWMVQDVAALGSDRVKTLEYSYDFNGNVLQIVYQKGQAEAFYHHYVYDAAQRLTAVYTSPNGSTKTLQAEYSYYLHGPLKRVQLAGNLQGIDYAYTLQGTLKSINHVNASLEPGHDSPQRNGIYKDLFALTLDYFSGDHRSRGLDVMLPTSSNVPTRYDGTIQGAAWRTPASPDVQRVVYTYDEKSQLQSTTHGRLGISGAYYYFTPSANKALQESGLTYDLNGNLQSLRRNDQNGTTTDNFSYTYKPNTNQLKEVHTGTPNGATVIDYDYDELGQVTRQNDAQGQRYFTYDVAGKTTGIYFNAARTNPLVTYTYDDRGFRLSKTSSVQGTSAPARTTYYVRDPSGNILATYEKDAPWNAVQRTEVPLYGMGRLGTLVRLADGTLDARYEMLDHRGDTRVVFHRPTTDVGKETLDPGVAARYAFQGAGTYAYQSSRARSAPNVALLDGRSSTAPTLRRVVTVEKGDTITFTAWARITGNFNTPAAISSPSKARVLMRPFLLLGASDASTPGSFDGQAVPPRVGASRWLSRAALGLSFALPGKRPVTLPLAAQAGATEAVEPPAARTGGYSAWIQYRVLDANGNQVGSTQIALLPNTTPTDWQELRLGVRVQQAGTVELIATSTEAGTYIMFDDLEVKQTGGLVVQEQHQYALGAPLPGLSYTVGDRRYRHGYQGQYAEHDDETGFESFQLRLYNSRIGRWLNTDPESQFSSPYLAMGNNPVSQIDPDGSWAWFGAAVGAVAGGAIGGAVASANGGDFWTGAAIGAVAGFAAGGLLGPELHSVGNYAKPGTTMYYFTWDNPFGFLQGFGREGAVAPLKSTQPAIISIPPAQALPSSLSLRVPSMLDEVVVIGRRAAAVPVSAASTAIRTVAAPSPNQAQAPGGHSYLDRAMEYAGTKYVYGGMSKQGTDCSGLIQLGVGLKTRKWSTGQGAPPGSWNRVYPKTTNAQSFLAGVYRGDLFVWSGSHAAFYLGGGSIFHAPHTGDVVRQTNDLVGYWLKSHGYPNVYRQK